MFAMKAFGLVVMVINDGASQRLGYLRWGFIPPWAKDEKIGYKMINARAETLAEKPSFRKPLISKRCIIGCFLFESIRFHS